jgi:hypothetical protein
LEKLLQGHAELYFSVSAMDTINLLNVFVLVHNVLLFVDLPLWWNLR